MNSKAIRLALLLLFGLAPLLPAQSPPGPPPGPPGDTMKSLQEIWEEIADLKAQNTSLGHSEDRAEALGSATSGGSV